MRQELLSVSDKVRVTVFFLQSGHLSVNSFSHIELVKIGAENTDVLLFQPALAPTDTGERKVPHSPAQRV